LFAPFTADEVEGIRSLVLIGQQQDDMLLLNCSPRPLPETRSFIQRFRSLLLDSTTPTSEITKSANEQYVAIIAGVDVKRANRQARITSAASMANLTSPLMQTMPFKFRLKYARLESELDQPPPPPTRSRSVCEGLVLPDAVVTSEEAAPAPPPARRTFRGAEANAAVLALGTLAALLREGGGPGTFCRGSGETKFAGPLRYW
jgi:hypothetical protein